MDFEQLRRGERYLFHKNYNGNIKYFRGTYLGIHIREQYITIVLENYEDRDTKIDKKKIYFIIGNNIIHAETLKDILIDENCKLNDDILYEINKLY
jgi:hypothetical protein